MTLRVLNNEEDSTSTGCGHVTDIVFSNLRSHLPIFVVLLHYLCGTMMLFWGALGPVTYACALLDSDAVSQYNTLLHSLGPKSRIYL
jgi:hypothetical protein